MGLFDKILGKRSAEQMSKPPEHAVLVHFAYGSTDLSRLFALQARLEAAIAATGVGEFDGHDVAADGSDANLYMYGPDADALFAAVRPVLDVTEFLRGARVRVRYGPPADGVREVEIVLGTQQRAADGARADADQHRVGRTRPPMDDDLPRLGLKLLSTYHLNVPERMALPRAGMPFSVLVAAVGAELKTNGWFPQSVNPGVDFGEGARLELRGPDLWLHEQHETGLGRFGPIQSRRLRSIDEGVRLYIAANGGSPMDGVSIDWDA